MLADTHRRRTGGGIGNEAQPQMLFMAKVGGRDGEEGAALPPANE